MRGARTGGGTPDGIRPRLDAGLEQGAKHSFFSSRPHFQSGVIQTGVRSEISSFVAGCTENPYAAATLITLLDPPAVPSRPVLRSFPPSVVFRPFPAVACLPAAFGHHRASALRHDRLRLAVLGTFGARTARRLAGTLGRGPCSRPSPPSVI